MKKKLLSIKTTQHWEVFLLLLGFISYLTERRAEFCSQLWDFRAAWNIVMLEFQGAPGIHA